MTQPIKIAQAVRSACVLAVLEGYERAQIAGLCHEGAWEAAVDAIRMLDLNEILQQMPSGDPLPPTPHGPSSV